MLDGLERSIVNVKVSHQAPHTALEAAQRKLPPPKTSHFRYAHLSDRNSTHWHILLLILLVAGEVRGVFLLDMF